MRQHPIGYINIWYPSLDLENMGLLYCPTVMDIPHVIELFAKAGKGTPIIEKIMNNPLDKEVKESLWYCVRNKRLLEKPSNILVKGKSGKLYPLKVRPNYDYHPLFCYIEYNEDHDMNHDYKEIQGKFIIIDKLQFNMRGKEILSNL